MNIRQIVLISLFSLIIFSCKKEPVICDNPVEVYVENNKDITLIVKSSLGVKKLGRRESALVYKSTFLSKEIIKIELEPHYRQEDRAPIMRLEKEVDIINCESPITLSVDDFDVLFDIRDQIAGVYDCTCRCIKKEPPSPDYPDGLDIDTTYQKKFVIKKSDTKPNSICWDNVAVCQSFIIDGDKFTSQYSGPLRNVHFGIIDAKADTMVYNYSGCATCRGKLK